MKNLLKNRNNFLRLKNAKSSEWMSLLSVEQWKKDSNQNIFFYNFIITRIHRKILKVFRGWTWDTYCKGTSRKVQPPAVFKSLGSSGFLPLIYVWLGLVLEDQGSCGWRPTHRKNCLSWPMRGRSAPVWKVRFCPWLWRQASSSESNTVSVASWSR